MPENKVKIENGWTQVLWKGVDKNAGVREEYFEATNLREGSKKDCGEFINRLKKSRKKACISNQGGRSH